MLENDYFYVTVECILNQRKVLDWISSLSCTLMQLLPYILKCNHLE